MSSSFNPLLPSAAGLGATAPAALFEDDFQTVHTPSSGDRQWQSSSDRFDRCKQDVVCFNITKDRDDDLHPQLPLVASTRRRRVHIRIKPYSRLYLGCLRLVRFAHFPDEQIRALNSTAARLQEGRRTEPTIFSTSTITMKSRGSTTVLAKVALLFAILQTKV
ncbi:hypothetical protein DAPPUDRAFT_243203 [Daphnia pulex]|uniref:Uncharacterized protein n=1 Tax=Daphnia pulex TaxID=6669 RepID=E9GI84_DAPPU|nr:hypothetical protein DAPPUDRAFT_243203 [Daphnia pulex]|eukprot:EFX80633.1 hypothetical protein DAPPUDRAFT_243203 [Daphnia pulex]